MSLLSFKDVRPWAWAIREKVASRVMPPWHADRAYGAFRNNPSLSQAEIDTIVSWVNAGAPEGNPKDTPALPKFAEGWQIGKPDQVFEMASDFEIPARGTIEYTFPVIEKVRGAVFYDIGFVNAGSYKFNPSKMPNGSGGLNMDVGIGVRAGG